MLLMGTKHSEQWKHDRLQESWCCVQCLILRQGSWGYIQAQVQWQEGALPIDGNRLASFEMNAFPRDKNYTK